MTHTKGQWRNDRGLIRSQDGAIAGAIYDLDGDTPINYDVAHANAAFIVRACNSYGAMREALKELADMARVQLDQSATNTGLANCHLLAKAREAIRLAEGRG